MMVITPSSMTAVTDMEISKSSERGGAHPARADLAGEEIFILPRVAEQHGECHLVAMLRSFRIHLAVRRDRSFGSWSCDNAMAEALTAGDLSEVVALGHFVEFDRFAD
jgi:hypothetical protein